MNDLETSTTGQPPAVREPSSFTSRLRDAFDGESNATIARRITTPDATVSLWMRGERLPDYRMLVRITKATGVNLHWLITGTGPRRVEQDNEIFSVEEEREIRELAKTTGRTYDEQVRTLTLAAIDLVNQTR